MLLSHLIDDRAEAQECHEPVNVNFRQGAQHYKISLFIPLLNDSQ